MCLFLYSINNQTTSAAKLDKRNFMEKLVTAKKMLPCVKIENWFVILKTDGTFTFHDQTNAINPYNEDQAKGYASFFIEKAKQIANFNEAPFIAAFEKFKVDRAEKQRKEAEQLAAEKAAAELAEKNRIASIKKTILACETPSELIEAFALDFIETAGHWSDLHEGRSHYAVKVNSLENYEIMQMAVELLNIEGNFGEAKNRAGEHHWTFSNYSYDLKHYQANCKQHFNGDNYFYKSQDQDEEEYTLEKIKEANTLDEVRKLISKFDDLETGYYDCNGNLMMLESDLEAPDFTGYSEDVYTYTFAFEFKHKRSFTIIEEEEEN